MSSADLTIYTPGIGTLLCGRISSGKKSAFVHFAAVIANHYSLAFSFHQVPISAGPAGWTEAAWYERFARHLCIWPAAWLEHQAVTGDHPSNLTFVIWCELVTTWPHATNKIFIHYLIMLMPYFKLEIKKKSSYPLFPCRCLPHKPFAPRV